MRRFWPLIMMKFVVFFAIALAVLGLVVQYLWNALMPALFGLPSVTFWQGVGLLALSWLLFGGFRGFRGHGYRGHWRRRMMERWAHMTPEEREKFREGIRARCGHFPQTAERKI